MGDTIMKAKLFSSQGESKGEIDLPELFNTKPRFDLVQKFFEADKLTQPYSPDPKAGRQHSASGTISHKRHDWKGHYGRGISRIPRKTMWRRGTQFFWIGAEVSGTRGGRRAHPPKGIGKERKINKKEIQLVINSALAATANPDLITKRYETLDKPPEAPIVIESLPKKTKDLISTLKKIFSISSHLILNPFGLAKENPEEENTNQTPDC
jgi:large subunit ribosomal protein L4e